MTFETAVQTTGVDPDVSAAIVIFDRMKPVRDALGMANLTDNEIQLFAMVAHHTGLDPFTKQIYAIKRGGKVIHQTGIDGYRSTAERTKEYRGSDAPVFEACPCGNADSPPEHPKIARVTVYRAYPDGIRPQVGEARWHELKPKHTKGNYGYADDMWWQMPENQLAKCAEANGLRKAFPRVLGGVYITEEMEQAGPGDNGPLLTAAAQPTARDRVAARRAAIEAAEASVADDGEALFVEGESVEVSDALPFAADPVDVEALRETIRSKAAVSGMTGPMTDPQRGDLVRIFGPIGGRAARAGVAALWPDAVPESMTAAQANAVTMAADSDPEFAAHWAALASQEAAT